MGSGFERVRSADLYAHRLLERMERIGEATAQQRWATGAGVGAVDPIDPGSDHIGYRLVGAGGPREVPERTREQARTDSVAAYRANPLGRAIIDTYVAFCVGDSGLTLNCSSDQVRPFAESFWTDPRNMLPNGQELMLRTWLLMGEQLQEMMAAQLTGVCRRSPIDTTRIVEVTLEAGNPLWPEKVWLRVPGLDPISRDVVAVRDVDGLRGGEVMFWPAFRTLETDTRGFPFLGPVLDWLDSYDNIMSNLIDRTALARYMVWDVTVEGDPEKTAGIRADIEKKGAPRSGSVNVHNDKVTWEAKSSEAGSYEDSNTVKTSMTSIAAGSGLSKVWLAEPEDANRATSLTMAEPVRRRIGSVQNQWLANVQEMVRFAVDQAVRARRIPEMVEISGAGGVPVMVPAASTITITGPEIAAADAKVTAEVLFRVGLAVKELQAARVMSPAAAKELAKKAWEDYAGVPYRAELDTENADVNEIATAVDDADGGDLMTQLLGAAA